jgi:hypothetical protein
MFKQLLGFCKDGSALLTLIIFLLFSNLITIILTSSHIGKHLDHQDAAIELIIRAELKNKEENEKFRNSMHRGLSMVLSGQSQIVLNQNELNVGLLRVHHFVEPHKDKFYPNCPECREKSKPTISPSEKVTLR